MNTQMTDIILKEKAQFIVKHADKKTLRKIFGVSPSKFLLLQTSGEEKMVSFLEKKFEKTDEKTINLFITQIK